MSTRTKALKGKDRLEEQHPMHLLRAIKLNTKAAWQAEVEAVRYCRC